MNIFVTSDCPVECAAFLDDKRVIKMVLETAQILSTALRLHGVDDSRLYKATHKNHPCSIWCRETISNFMWTFKHFNALCREFRKRRGKAHKAESLRDCFLSHINAIPEGSLTPFANCAANKSLGLDFRHYENIHMGYQLYLNERWDNDILTPTWYGKIK